MEKDNLLEAFFEMPRWEAAINKGLLKDIDKGVLARLCSPDGRAEMCREIEDGTYEIQPPHTAKIPKDDPGEFRTVYVNEPKDRILLAIANDLLFDKMRDFIHTRCMSYLKGIGCGRVVKDASELVVNAKDKWIGFKADLSKYFDSVPLRFIDKAFDDVEAECGKSKLIDVIRKYYHDDTYWNSEDKCIEHKYQSLKQGCSVAAYLADVILYDIDEKLSSMGGFYVRYSDDILYIGKNFQDAEAMLEWMLNGMSLKLNPKKVEWLQKDRWFRFLGFSIRGKDISLSAPRLKQFQHEVEWRSTKCKKLWRAENKEAAGREATRRIVRFLYKGDGRHSWATSVLPVVNVRRDVDEMSKFVMDCIRGIYTGKRRTGGLGYDPDGEFGVVLRGRGQNVTNNRRKVGKIEGFYTLGAMQNAMLSSRSAYQALCAAM